MYYRCKYIVYSLYMQAKCRKFSIWKMKLSIGWMRTKITKG